MVMKIKYQTREGSDHGTLIGPVPKEQSPEPNSNTEYMYT